VDLPIVAFEAAVNVTFCAVPGVSANVAGLGVIPAGSPLSETFTLPVNPLIAVAVTVIACPLAPAVNARLPGATAREKSGAGGGGTAAATLSTKAAMWLRLPEVPVNVMVELPVTAFDAAVRVTLCAMPGVSVNVAGLAVTPAGSPLSKTFTLAVNPLTAVAVTVIACPFAPAVNARLPGATAREKSGGGGGGAAAIVSPTAATWLRLPDIPVSVIVEFTATAFDAAVSVTLCAMPGTSVNVEGLAVTPAGNPLSETFTLPVNPLTAVAVTAIACPFAPAVNARLPGATAREKSAAGGGGTTAATLRTKAAVWLRLPDVPVKVMVELPAAALDEAVSVMLCAAPGVSTNVAGLAVTPVGSPLRVTFTLLVNPFNPVAVTATACPFAPAVKARLPGATAREKSAVGGGGGTTAATLRTKAAVWLRLPEVPVNVMVELLTAAFDEAVKVTLCATPGVRVNAEGLAVTPAGRLLRVTFTLPVNPFTAVAVTATVCPFAPAVKARLPGATAREKSATGGGTTAATLRTKAAVWLRLPDMPVNVMVELPAAAFDEAVSVTLCAMPGVRVNAEGLAVTPAGNPLSETFTLSVNPFIAVAVTAIACPFAPAINARPPGATAKEKSAAGGGGTTAATVNTRAAVWLRLPEVPVRVMVELPATAFEAAVNVTLCAMPGVSVNVEGLAVTPAGNPLSETFTLPVNPLTAVAVTAIACPRAPAVNARLPGATAREKSAAGGGGATTPTASARASVWLRFPEVPVRAIVAVFAAALAEAVRVTLCAVPGINVNVAELAVTPDGKPLRVRSTLPENPSIALAVTEIACPAAPGIRFSVDGETVRLKSAWRPVPIDSGLFRLVPQAVRPTRIPPARSGTSDIGAKRISTYLR
jgi:hypothetical protein